jgi:hypothetical protein
MKRISTIALVLLCIVGQFTANAQSQNGKNFRFDFKTNPLAALGGPLWVTVVPITGEYKLLFEAKTARKQTIEVGMSYLGPSAFINLDKLSENDSVSGVHTSGYRVQLAYKFFVTKNEAPEGFYVAPHVSYAKARIEDKDHTSDYIEASKLNVDVLLGYQVVTGGGFVFNVYTGLGLKVRDIDYPNESSFSFDTYNDARPNVVMGFSFGFAF